MKATILKKRNSIIIQYRINSKQYRVYTSVNAKGYNWNKKNKSLIGTSENITSANQLIKRYRDEVETYVNDLKRSGTKYDHEQLKKYLILKLTTKIETEIKKDVFYAFDIFLKNKKSNYCSSTITAYKNTLSHLKKYCGDGLLYLPFNKLNKEWFEKYIHFLKTELFHATGTRSNQIKNIKAVLNYAHELELHDFTKYKSIKKEKEQSTNIYLSEIEIEQLGNTKFTNKIEQQFIDSFIFICLTGLRFSDYSNISKENFKLNDGYWNINFQQKKTKKEVAVPIIYKRACDIILKYDFSIPKYTNAYFNRRLKEIFLTYNMFSDEVMMFKEQQNLRCIKRDLITVHTGRRSFATNQFLKNTPINLIMAATGHESEKAFRTYIKATEIEKSKGLIKYADY